MPHQIRTADCHPGVDRLHRDAGAGRHPDSMGDHCRVVGLGTYGQLDRLMEQIRRFQPEVVVEWDEAAAASIRDRHIRVRGRPLIVLSGLKGLMELAAWPGANYVVSAVVGTIGLEPLSVGAARGQDRRAGQQGIPDHGRGTGHDAKRRSTARRSSPSTASIRPSSSACAGRILAPSNACSSPPRADPSTATKRLSRK